MELINLSAKTLPELHGKFLVVETLSDGYTGTVNGHYNYEVVTKGEDYEIYPTLWNNEKKSLHILIPHADIAYIDYWLGEATGCIAVGDFAEALTKLEVLTVICEQLPQQYRVSIENVF